MTFMAGTLHHLDDQDKLLSIHFFFYSTAFIPGMQATSGEIQADFMNGGFSRITKVRNESKQHQSSLNMWNEAAGTLAVAGQN